MPCHAPLNHSGGNRLWLRSPAPLLPCSCPQNWPLPTRSPKNRTCQAGPPLPRSRLLYRPRAVRRSSPVCITARSVFVRATRSEHQRSRERHIARYDQHAQAQTRPALCRNCDCQGIAVEALAKPGIISPPTIPHARRCTTMLAHYGSWLSVRLLVLSSRAREGSRAYFYRGPRHARRAGVIVRGKPESKDL